MNDDDAEAGADAALAAWFRHYQGFEPPADALYDPSRGAKHLGDLMRERAIGLAFDSEPARFARLLHDLAPDDLKR